MSMSRMFRSRRFAAQPHPIRAATAYRDRLKAELAMVDEFLEAAEKLAADSGSEEFAFMLLAGAQNPRASHLRLVKG